MPELPLILAFGPIVLGQGTIVLEAFGVALAVGLTLGVLATRHLARSTGLDARTLGDVLVGAGLGAFIGARLLYVLGSPERESLRAVLAFGAGGLSGYGAWLGAGAVAAVLLSRRRSPLLPWGDVLAPGALLATSVTRLGCYVQGCDFGKPFRGATAALHPTQLYEAFGALALCVACLWLRREQRRHGTVLEFAVAGYALLRLIVEPFRGDADRGLWLWLSVTSVCAFATLGAIVARRAFLGYSRRVRY